MYSIFLFLVFCLSYTWAETLETIDVTSSALLPSEHLSPVPVKVISRKEIQDSGAQRLQDILYLKEGVSFVRSGTKLAPSIRGFSPEHTLFLIDGQRIANEPTNKYDLERIELVNIERIEIIKGPMSTLYGADALGGVINLITKKNRRDKVLVSLRNGTYDLKSPRNALSAQVDKAYDYGTISLFGTHIKEDPLYFNSKESIDDEKEINSAGISAHYRKGKVEMAARQSWSKDQHRSRDYNFLNSSYVFDDDRHQRTFSSGQLKLEQGRLRHTGMYSYSSYKKAGDTHLQSNRDLLMTKRARIYVTEMNYRTELSTDDHLLTVGLNHRREDFFGNAFNYQDHSKYLPHYYSLFVLDQWTATDRLLVIPALRQEKLNYFDDKLLAQLGITYGLDAEMSQNIKANYAQGYRVPTPKDLYVDVLIMQGNPELAAETSHSYNFEYNLRRDQTELKAGLFYNRIQQLIQEYYHSGLDKYTFRNLAHAEIRGGELFWRQKFSRHENSLTYTFLDAADSTGSRLPARAPSRHFQYDIYSQTLGSEQ